VLLYETVARICGVSVCVINCVSVSTQEMLSPKAVHPLSSRDKVLMQCDQMQPMHFDELLSHGSVEAHSLVLDLLK